MVNSQVVMGLNLRSQEINKNVVMRKLDLIYDLDSILEKLHDKVEAQNK